MAKRPRRNHSSTFKAKVALAAIKGDKTIVELSEQFDVHANQITQLKNQLLERAAEAFGGSDSKDPCRYQNATCQDRGARARERFFRRRARHQPRQRLLPAATGQ